MFKKFKTMSQGKKINIEDGNAKEQVKNENTEQGANQTDNKVSSESQEQGAKDIDIKEDVADKQAENTDNAAESTDNTTEKDGAKELSPLEKAQQEVEELKKQLLYKTAEFENYRKRTLKEKAELILNGGEKTISAILPVLDDFERALADKSEDPKVIK